MTFINAFLFCDFYCFYCFISGQGRVFLVMVMVAYTQGKYASFGIAGGWQHDTIAWHLHGLHGGGICHCFIWAVQSFSGYGNGCIHSREVCFFLDCRWMVA